MTLERAQCRVWCSKISWQTVPCSWSVDGEPALTNSSPGARDQQSSVVASILAVVCMFVCYAESAKSRCNRYLVDKDMKFGRCVKKWSQTAGRIRRLEWYEYSE